MYTSMCTPYLTLLLSVAAVVCLSCFVGECLFSLWPWSLSPWVWGGEAPLFYPSFARPCLGYERNGSLLERDDTGLYEQAGSHMPGKESLKILVKHQTIKHSFSPCNMLLQSNKRTCMYVVHPPSQKLVSISASAKKFSWKSTQL